MGESLRTALVGAARRYVMDAWAKFCAQPAPAGDNVVGLRAAG
jgi:hypothetical protein